MDLTSMICLLRDDLANEISHMMFYLTNSASLKGLHRQEIRELFIEEAESEMEHVRQFQDLIVGLGGNVMCITPPTPPYFSDPQLAIQYAYQMETQVVANYVQRMQDAKNLGGVDGQFIEVFLEEQILHSRTDADNFRLLSM